MDDLTLRRQIRRQGETIKGLASSGLDTTDAEALLRALQKLHAVYVANRDRVRNGLDERISMVGPKGASSA